MTEDNEKPICFFCYDDDSEMPFVTPHPCKCTGTTRVHVECFGIVRKSYKSCGACGVKYTSKRVQLMRNGLPLIITYYKQNITEMVENIPPPKKEEFTISAHGIKHGEYLLFARNGNLLKRSYYENNKLHGLETIYTPDGTVMDTLTYAHGKKEGTYKKYYPNGHVEIEAQFYNNELHGPYTRYYANDNIMVSYVYQNGLKHGPCKHYYPRGELQINSHYLYDKLHGSYYDYKKDGTMIKFTIYDQGSELNPIPHLE